LFVLTWQAVKKQSEHLVGFMLFIAWTHVLICVCLCVFKLPLLNRHVLCDLLSILAVSLCGSMSGSQCETARDRARQRETGREGFPPSHTSVCLSVSQCSILTVIITEKLYLYAQVFKSSQTE